jgi:hypothetical protein
MRLTLHLPDDIGEEYERQAKARRITLSKVIAQQLARFVKVDTHDRIIVVDRVNRTRLERILSTGGHLQDADDLVQRVLRVAQLSIEGIDLEFSPAEKEQIALRAKKNRITPEAELARVVNDMKYKFFDFIT